jgi:hypothetical protein
LFTALVLFIWFTRPDPLPAKPATAVFNIIPVPTITPLVPLASITPVAPPTSLPPTGSGDTISLGAYVQITGTGGDGLRVRAAPGLDGAVRFIAIESEVFQITDGPQEADGYIWWYLSAPYEDTVQGWAVSNYLAVIQNP